MWRMRYYFNARKVYSPFCVKIFVLISVFFVVSARLFNEFWLHAQVGRWRVCVEDRGIDTECDQGDAGICRSSRYWKTRCQDDETHENAQVLSYKNIVQLNNFIDVFVKILH